MLNICYFNSTFLFLCQDDETIDTEMNNSVETQLITFGKKLSCRDPVYIAAEAGVVVWQLYNMGFTVFTGW